MLRRLWRLLQVVSAVVLVGVAIRAIAVNWQSLRAQPIEWQFSVVWVVASILVVFASYAVLIEAWRRVVMSMGQRLGFLPAARIWFLASLGKYIPGKVWSLAGAAVLAQRAGVAPAVAVSATMVLQALALASGAAVVAVTAREAFQSVGQEFLPIAALVLILSLAGVAMLASQPFLDRIRRLLPSAWPRPRAVPLSKLGAAFLGNLMAWTGYGWAILLLSRGLLGELTLTLAQMVGVFTCSYLVGFIALFAPGGLGPREAVFLLLLADDIGLKHAAALALASRLLLTGTEVLPAVTFLVRRSAPTPSSIHEV